MSSSNRNNTLISIGLGMGALVFAFFMVFSDPQNGGQMMAQGGQMLQQMQTSAANLVKPAPQPQEALGPESRLDMTMNAAPLPSGNDMAVRSGAGDSSKSSVDSYLDGAWGSPQAAQQAQQMPQQNFNRGMPQRHQSFGQQSFARQGFGSHGFGQRGFSQQQRGFSPQGAGGAQGMGDFREMMKQMNSQGGGGMAPAQQSANVGSARGAVENEVSYARNQRNQARGCLNQARSTQENSEKQSAASGARSHAAQAAAAASRAASRASGNSELQGLVGQARNFANQAESAANEAASASSGW